MNEQPRSHFEKIKNLRNTGYLLILTDICTCVLSLSTTVSKSQDYVQMVLEVYDLFLAA